MTKIKEIDDGTKLKILRTIDKADRMEPVDLFNLLTEGRKDKSGDFTEGAGLHPWQAIILLRATVLWKHDYIDRRFDFIDKIDDDDFHIMMDEYDAMIPKPNLAEFIDDRIANRH